MNISARCEYACRAMAELGRHAGTQETLPSCVIAERRRIPEKYLVHILLQLKRAGLVHSVRGKQGGYRLAREPREISLRDVVEAVDGPVLDPLPVKEAAPDILTPIWARVADRMDKVLEETTVADLAEEAVASNMYYI